MLELLPGKQAQKKVFRLGLTLTPAQAAIDANPARFKIVRSGRKFGKTTYAQKKALDWMGPPNSTVWYISPTYRQGKLISWAEFKRIIPQEAFGKKPNDTDLVITLKNGSSLYLMGSDDPDSLRGPAPTGVIFEEAAFHRREAWYEVVRPNLMPKRSPALFIGTPKGFNWFHDLEDDAKRRIAAGDKDWAVFHYNVYDNPHISKQEIEEARRDCDTDAVWRQEYMAEYESSVGRVFAAFDDARHCRKIEIPQKGTSVYRAIDWGMRDDTACLWGYVRGGILYVYREYLANDLSAPAQAQIIKNMTGTGEKIEREVISHDASKQDPAMKGLTVLWHFRHAGLSVVPSSRDKKHSRAMIQELLRQNRIVIDQDRCPKLRKQIMAYEWKDTAMEKTDDTGNDDAIDALHYLVELLQFELFMDQSAKTELSYAEIMGEIAKEKLQQQTPKLSIPLIYKGDDEFGSSMENTSAGYL